MSPFAPPFLSPVPAPSPRPWAGTRLAPAGSSTGELWVAAPGLDAGDGTGRTLDAVAADAGEAFVGAAPLRRYGPRFPLIVKLIDAADWLSLQVHPDDALAAELSGPGAVGKREAWLVLDADPGSRLVTGPRRSLGAASLRDMVAAGTLGLDACEVRDAVPGDALVLRPGTLHAIGAGAFVYEIEQPSDITFRISDWGRPAVPGRALHPAESLRALDPALHAVPAGGGWVLDGGRIMTPDFRLELAGPGERCWRTPAGRSLEVVTAVEGTATVGGEGWTVALGTFGTVIVPAACEGYEVAVAAGGRACIGSLG